MDALKRSLASEKQAAPAAPEKAKGKKPKKAAAGQREMLLPISGGGKRAAKETAKERAEEGGEAGAHSRPHQEGRMIGQASAIASSSARCPGRPRSMTRYRFAAEAGS